MASSGAVTVNTPSMAPPAMPAIPSLDDSFGVMFIGVVIAATLWGASCVQAYLYMVTYSTDASYLKAIVAIVWALDTVHQAFITHTLYVYLVSNFFNPLALGTVVWTLVGQVIASAFVALIVKTFFGIRAWRLSQKNYFIGGIIGALIIAEFVASLIFVVKSFKFTFLAEAATIRGLSISVNVLAAAGDAVIAASLIILLLRSKTGFSRSDSLIEKMVAWSLSTGFITFICAIASMISILARPDGLIYIFFYFILARMYTNSFLATLNARRGLRETQFSGGDSQGASVSLQERSKRSRRPTVNTLPMDRKEPQTLSIKIDSETTHDYYEPQDPVPSHYTAAYKA